MCFAKLTKRIASAMIVDSDLINIRTQIPSRLHAWNMANHDWYKNRKVGTDLHSFKFFQNLCCFSRNLFPNLQNIKRKSKAEKGCFLWVSNPLPLVLRWERIEGSWAVLGYIGGRSSWSMGGKVVMWCYGVLSRDVTAAILVSLNKGTAAMLVSLTNPLETLFLCKLFL